MYRAFFDRKKGLFTLQDSNGPIFKQLRARSGQRGFDSTNWVRGKSPIPWSSVAGTYYLWIDAPVSKDAALPTGRGIGQFFQISNQPENRNLIQNPLGKETREAIGLHPENGIPGSVGCIVLLHETPDEATKVKKLFDFLEGLGKRQQTIPLIVL